MSCLLNDCKIVKTDSSAIFYNYKQTMLCRSKIKLTGAWKTTMCLKPKCGQHWKFESTEWAKTSRTWCSLFLSIITTTTVLRPFFPKPPRWAGARIKILDFMVQGKINRGRHTNHPAGRHSIQTNQCPPLPSTHFFTGRMPFLPPNQQCQSTECKHSINKTNMN